MLIPSTSGTPFKILCYLATLVPLHVRNRENDEGYADVLNCANISHHIQREGLCSHCTSKILWASPRHRLR